MCKTLEQGQPKPAHSKHLARCVELSLYGAYWSEAESKTPPTAFPVILRLAAKWTRIRSKKCAKAEQNMPQRIHSIEDMPEKRTPSPW